MSQDGDDAVSDEIMVAEVSSSTPDISESTDHSADDVMVGIVDSSVPSPMVEEVADEYYNSDDMIIGDDASPPIPQEVVNEYANADDFMVGSNGSNVASSPMSQEVDSECSNSGAFMIETADSENTSSSTSQGFVDECSNTGDIMIRSMGSDDSSSISQEISNECFNTGDLMIETTCHDNSSSVSQEFGDECSIIGDSMVGTIDRTDTPLISQEITEYSNVHIGTVEDHSIAGEFSELVLSGSLENSEDRRLSEECNTPPPINSETSPNTSNLSVDQTDNKNEIVLSPSKRRHLSSKEEPESKKSNTSKEFDQVSIDSNPSTKLKGTIDFQYPVNTSEYDSEIPSRRTEDPELGNLERNTDSHSSNVKETLVLQSPVDSSENVIEVAPRKTEDPKLGNLELNTDSHTGNVKETPVDSLEYVIEVAPRKTAEPVLDNLKLNTDKYSANVDKTLVLQSPVNPSEFVTEVVPRRIEDSVIGNLELNADSHSANVKETPVLQSPVDPSEYVIEVALPRTEDPVLGKLELNTDPEKDATESNDSNKTPVFKEPPIPGLEIFTKIHKENPKVSAFLDNARLTWETNLQGFSDQAVNLSSRSIPSGSEDTLKPSQSKEDKTLKPSQSKEDNTLKPSHSKKDNTLKPSQSKEDISGESQFEIATAVHQSQQEFLNSAVANIAKERDLTTEPTPDSFPIHLPNEIQPLTRDDLISELQSLVGEYMKGNLAESLEESIVAEHLRTYQMQFIESINGFQVSMEHILAGISDLDSSSYINASSLEVISSDFILAAINVEKTWREFKVLISEKSDSINVDNLTQHHARCLQYFEKFIIAILGHIDTIPDDYPES